MHIKGFDPYDFSKKEVEGVPVYYKNLPWAPCINIHVVVKTGSFDDPVGKEGLSHFLEHAVFTGSKKFKDQKATDDWSKKYAINSLNAWTSFNETSYHLKCLPEHYNEALSGVFDIVSNPKLLEKDVEHERGIITQEAWRRFKNEKFLTYTKEVGEIIQPGHTYARHPAPLGWPETIAKITQADLRDWHRERYVKENIFVLIAGAVEEKHIKALEAYIKKLPKGEASSYTKSEVKKPLKKEIVRNSEDIGDPEEQVEISIIRTMEPLPQKFLALASIFRYVLGDILFERLRTEKGLCYGVSVSCGFYGDFTPVQMNIKTDEKNIDLVQKEFWKVLKELKAGKFKKNFTVLKQVVYEYAKSKELLSGGVATAAVKDVVRYGEVNNLTSELVAIKKVTYAAMVKFAEEAFDPEWTVTEIILPAKKTLSHA